MDDDVFEMESVEVIGDHAIRLTFADGLIREIDLDYWIGGPQGEPLRDPAYFALVKVDQLSATIVWPNGAHLHSGFLHDHARELRSV
jgi:hypothetical protein